MMRLKTNSHFVFLFLCKSHSIIRHAERPAVTLTYRARGAVTKEKSNLSPSGAAFPDKSSKDALRNQCDVNHLAQTLFARLNRIMIHARGRATCGSYA